MLHTPKEKIGSLFAFCVENADLAAGLYVSTHLEERSVPSTPRLLVRRSTRRKLFQCDKNGAFHPGPNPVPLSL